VDVKSFPLVVVAIDVESVGPLGLHRDVVAQKLERHAAALLVLLRDAIAGRVIEDGPIIVGAAERGQCNVLIRMCPLHQIVIAKDVELLLTFANCWGRQ
jgi:hypothetical protein